MNFVSRKKLNQIEKKYDVQWFILLGQRSNGKSTAVKHNFIETAYNGQGKFVYIRRYAADMKKYMINSYFKNVPGMNVSEITRGEYDGIECRGNELLFYKDSINDKGEVKRTYNKEPTGYVASLSESEHFKSLNFPDVKYAIFEEFSTDKVYLADEVTILFNLISTIFRNEKGCVYLVANTISKVNPYFREFNLDKINRQKIGTVDIYKYDNTNIACYLTAPIEGNENTDIMYFGSRARMINKGEWHQNEKRKREFKNEEYTTIYTMVFEFHDSCFLMEFQRNTKGGHVWFISPKTTPIQKGTRLVTNRNIEKDIHTFGFVPLSENERKIFEFIKNRKIAFADNLTGTEFTTAYKQMLQEAL